MFGGSAGREAPAVQLSGALIDHLSHILKSRKITENLLNRQYWRGLCRGCLALPLAGAIYGLEITALGNLRYSAIFPCFVSALIASAIPELFEIVHPHVFM